MKRKQDDFTEPEAKRQGSSVAAHYNALSRDMTDRLRSRISTTGSKHRKSNATHGHGTQSLISAVAREVILTSGKSQIFPPSLVLHC
ncbi:hypothetical protein M427DRAFT_59113 [Gonapodya prolifera JEL478]|uniref:Uncharacterized protein n=1 Tax=Gonapodya prolifera (strain JEL478) TaxID=1344416 RepID=A0A139A8A1_GONPJ|nr:hypothetical protein M427DRAFT_59113 [Gonapodya prolifera JEL478]|eukprot:KXS13010.1 hypothetical protein M427DRAFT_59113 [Gonapodya prolifera JEL478]